MKIHWVYLLQPIPQPRGGGVGGHIPTTQGGGVGIGGHIPTAQGGGVGGHTPTAQGGGVGGRTPTIQGGGVGGRTPTIQGVELEAIPLPAFSREEDIINVNPTKGRATWPGA